MHRHSLQRWSIVLLLIARLVLGELAHAMPHQSESSNADLPAAAQAQEVPCPDHAGNSDAPRLSTEPEGQTLKSDDAGSHDPNCCKTACECACLHLSALAMPIAMVSVAALDQRLVPATALGHTPDRIFLLFRPPA